MKNKIIILVFLFASILATMGIASGAVNDSDGDGIIDYLDPFPNQVEAATPVWNVGNNWNYTFTSLNFTAYMTQSVVEIKEIEVFDQNGTSMGKQEFYIMNRTHPIHGELQIYFTKPGANIYKMVYSNPNILSITNIPSLDYANFHLYEGKTWKQNLTQTFSNATINRPVKVTLDAKVIGKEILNTPAGTYDCFLIDVKVLNATTGSPFNLQKYWMSYFYSGVETPTIMPKYEVYLATAERSNIPSETWLLNKVNLMQKGEVGDIYIVKTPASPTPTKPAPGFELMAAAIGIITAISLCKRRF